MPPRFIGSGPLKSSLSSDRCYSNMHSPVSYCQRYFSHFRITRCVERVAVDVENTTPTVRVNSSSARSLYVSVRDPQVGTDYGVAEVVFGYAFSLERHPNAGVLRISLQDVHLRVRRLIPFAVLFPSASAYRRSTSVDLAQSDGDAANIARRS